MIFITHFMVQFGTDDKKNDDNYLVDVMMLMNITFGNMEVRK